MTDYVFGYIFGALGVSLVWYFSPVHTPKHNPISCHQELRKDGEYKICVEKLEY